MKTSHSVNTARSSSSKWALTLIAAAHAAGLCLLAAAPAAAQGLVEFAARGEVAVDNPFAPTELEQKVRMLFVEPPPPNPPIDPLTDDVTVDVFYPEDPCLRVFIPAGSFVARNEGYVVRDPLGSGVRVSLEEIPDPNDPNPQPGIVDLSEELVSVDVRFVKGKLPDDPSDLRLDLRFASQSPTPDFLPLNQVAQKVRLKIGDGVAEADMLWFAFDGGLVAGEAGLVDLFVRGEAHRDDPLAPTLLGVGWSVFAEPAPNGDGFDVTAEDVRLDVFMPIDPCNRIFVPAGIFAPSTQANHTGFVVRDPLAAGVQTVLEHPPDPNDPKGEPTLIDLAHEVASMDVRFRTDPGELRFEALYASPQPQPSFLPLNRAPRGVILEIGNDAGAVLVTRIEYAGIMTPEH